MKAVMPAEMPPQAAIAWMFLASVGILLVERWGWMLGLLAAAAWWGWLPASRLQRWWLGVAFLFTAWSLMLSQGFFYQAEQLTPLLEIPLPYDKRLSISQEGIWHGLQQSLRWGVLLLLAAGLLVRYSPDRLADGLRRMGFPTQAAFLFALALRHLPWLFSDVLTAGRTLRLRGISGWRWLTVIPAFIRSLASSNMRRADAVTLALLAKGLPQNTFNPTPPVKPLQKTLLYTCSLLLTIIIILRTMASLMQKGLLQPPPAASPTWDILVLLIAWLHRFL